MHSKARVRSYSASLALALLIGSSDALAQTITPGAPTPLDVAPPSRPQRPYRGLFGASVGEAAQSLTLEGSFGTALNVGDPAANLPVDDGSARIDPDAGSQSGGAGSGSAQLVYSRTDDRWGLYVSNLTTLEYYPNLNQYKNLVRDVFNSTVYFLPSKSTRIALNPHFKDLPEFSVADLFDTDLGQGIPIVQDLGIRLDRYRRYGVNIDMSQQFSKRARAFVSYQYAHGQIPTREWTLKLVSGKLRYAISKGVGFYVGGQYGGQRDENHNPPLRRDPHPRVDVGIDLNKELSFSRRTSIAFSTGTAGTHDRSTNQTTYHLIGGVKLSREFGRTWLTELIYSRNIRHIESLNEPLFNDSFTFAAEGSFSRRLQFKSQVGKALGRLGGPDAGGFDTYVGSVQLSIALTKYLGVGTQYSYYDYAVTKGDLPIQANGKIFPHRMGVHLQLYVPILRRVARDQQ